MDMPSVCWRRRGNLDMTSLASRKRGDGGRQSFLLQGTGSFALDKKNGVGLAVKESICRKSVYTHQLVDERLMSMRFELTGECAAVNLVFDCPNGSQPQRRAE